MFFHVEGIRFLQMKGMYPWAFHAEGSEFLYIKGYAPMNVSCSVIIEIRFSKKLSIIQK